LKKSFLNRELRTLLGSYRDHKDLINLKARWSTVTNPAAGSNLMAPPTTIGRTREDKLIEALELMLQRNILQSRKRSEII
jgi:hypothetical protein